MENQSPSHPTTPASDRSDPSVSLTDVRVLVVEDEAPARRYLRSLLEAEGASVVEAATAEQGLLILETGDEVAVALCDIRLPGNDGLWLAEQLQTASPLTAVVITTAVHEFDAAVTSLRSRAVDYLAKPFTRERLLEAIGRALLVYEARRAHRQILREVDERRAQITEALAELEANASSALDAMLAMLQARDSVSYDHAHRVAKLAVDLAMALQIAEPQLSNIERAALLHNLGRLTLPDKLVKQSEAALSGGDRARLRSYPLNGYAILRSVPILAAANEIAVASHERYDGSGFPHGLWGQNIPLGARIIGLADAYDELVSGIGYPQVSPGRALEILNGKRAAEFDPAVLAALKTLLASGVSS